MDEKQKELARLLDGMAVPEHRRADLGWLWRNLAINNIENENLEPALKLVKELRNLA